MVAANGKIGGFGFRWDSLIFKGFLLRGTQKPNPGIPFTTNLNTDGRLLGLPAILESSTRLSLFQWNLSMEVTESDEEDRKYLAKLREELDTFVGRIGGWMGWRPALVGCTVDSLDGSDIRRSKTS